MNAFMITYKTVRVILNKNSSTIHTSEWSTWYNLKS